jgi:hypothetical protein
MTSKDNGTYSNGPPSRRGAFVWLWQQISDGKGSRRWRCCGRRKESSLPTPKIPKRSRAALGGSRESGQQSDADEQAFHSALSFIK